MSGGLSLLKPDGTAVDVAEASGGRFTADPQAVYEQWAEFRAWADNTDLPAGGACKPADLDAPAPRPVGGEDLVEDPGRCFLTAVTGLRGRAGQGW